MDFLPAPGSIPFVAVVLVASAILWVGVGELAERWRRATDQPQESGDKEEESTKVGNLLDALVASAEEIRKESETPGQVTLFKSEEVIESGIPESGGWGVVTPYTSGQVERRGPGIGRPLRLIYVGTAMEPEVTEGQIQSIVLDAAEAIGIEGELRNKLLAEVHVRLAQAIAEGRVEPG